MGTFIMPCFLIVNMGNPPAVTPSRIQASERLETPFSRKPSANWPFRSSTLFALSMEALGVGGRERMGTGVQQVRNHQFKSWTQPTAADTSGPGRVASLWWHLHVMLDFLEYYLPFFKWLLITLTFQIETKFQQLVLQEHMSHGEKQQRESFPPSSHVEPCERGQIILFAWLNHVRHLLIGKEFEREKAGIQPQLFPEVFPAYPGRKIFLSLNSYCSVLFPDT